ncbi:MAG: hypothetical protein ABIE74_10825 [Pseudomonadota bacterium]
MFMYQSSPTKKSTIEWFGTTLLILGGFLIIAELVIFLKTRSFYDITIAITFSTLFKINVEIWLNSITIGTTVYTILYWTLFKIPLAAHFIILGWLIRMI